MSEPQVLRIRDENAPDTGPQIEIMVRGARAPDVNTRSGTRSSRRASGVVDQATSAVAGSFEGVLDGLRHVADSLTNVMENSVKAPDEMTVSFGVDFSAAARIVIVEGNGNASLNVTMTWRRDS